MVEGHPLKNGVGLWVYELMCGPKDPSSDPLAVRKILISAFFRSQDPILHFQITNFSRNFKCQSCISCYIRFVRLWNLVQGLGTVPGVDGQLFFKWPPSKARDQTALEMPYAYQIWSENNNNNNNWAECSTFVGSKVTLGSTRGRFALEWPTATNFVRRIPDQSVLCNDGVKCHAGISRGQPEVNLLRNTVWVLILVGEFLTRAYCIAEVRDYAWVSWGQPVVSIIRYAGCTFVNQPKCY